MNKRQTIDGRWVDAKPIPGPILIEATRRLKECWLILTNKARAIRWL